MHICNFFCTFAAFFMKYLSYISTTLLGLMFLMSAFAKAWDAEAFADMLLLYGPEWFSIGAPVIIFIEAVLGSLLLLRVRSRWSTMAAVAFLVVVSVIFAYGVAAKGIQDCGCFGALSKLYTGKPWMTFVRNAVFCLIAVPALITKDPSDKHLALKLMAAMLVGATACFICGLSMRKSFVLPQWDSVRTDSRADTMHKLDAIYPFSADSSYVVYLFSFTCAHCQNSFANLQQYHQMQVVDKVVGIAIENEEAQERFYRIYRPEIDIITIPQGAMADITGSLPIALLIKGDSIHKAESGSVTSPGIFLK